MAWLNFLRLYDYHGWSIAGVAETTPGGFVPSGRNWPSGIPIDLYADRPRLGSRTQGRSPGYGCLRDPWRHRPFDQELAAGSRLPPGALCDLRFPRQRQACFRRRANTSHSEQLVLPWPEADPSARSCLAAAVLYFDHRLAVATAPLIANRFRRKRDPPSRIKDIRPTRI